MSANVWFEQVDIGLINELKTTVRVLNHEGALVPLEEGAVIVRKPEEDFKIETFPCVSIYNTGYSFDPMRYVSEPSVVGRDTSSRTATIEENAVPYNLTYNIDFWARYQTDMNTMTMSFLWRHFRQFNLSVVDDGGKTRSCNCIISEQPKKSDLMLNKERLFHTIISCHIWVELDSETRYNVPIVIERGLNTEQNIK